VRRARAPPTFSVPAGRSRCLFSFADGRFRLESVHPGHTVEEVIENTGFDFDRPADVAETPAPSSGTLRLLREVVAPQLADVYPQFARQVFGVGAAAPL
jgi:glutaconate CoA-transferase subunit B